ncbi:MAG: hypothetical protein ABI862_04665 [Ilumatobacteraceae bacterium]
MRNPSRWSVVIVVVVVMTISSCSSTGDADTSIASQPVDSVRTNTSDGTSEAFGVPLAVGDIKVTASNPVVESDESGPSLTLTVRAENRTQVDVQAPLLELRCAGSTRGGTWLATSTFQQQEPVPPLSFNEGTLSLLMPGDERLGQPRPSCATPATVVATLLVFDNAGAGAPIQKRVAWAVPDEFVDQLNAAPQPG